MIDQNYNLTNSMVTLRERIVNHLRFIYRDLPDDQLQEHCNDLITCMDIKEERQNIARRENYWSQADIALITYGDSIKKHGENPLKTLKKFLDCYTNRPVSYTHLTLPTKRIV